MHGSGVLFHALTNVILVLQGDVCTESNVGYHIVSAVRIT
jgi:hypothetical protein